MRISFAVFVAGLGPLAVLLLGVQVVVFPHGGSAAIALIGGELAALVAALALAFLGVGRSHVLWLRDRLRAELLRRELFLLRMRVGPYLKSAQPSREQVDARVLQLDAEETDPARNLDLGDEPDGDWRTALEDERHLGHVSDVPCLPECLTDYLERRVEHQRSFFSERSEAHERRIRGLEGGAKMALVLALVVAALHLGMLASGPVHGGQVLHSGLAVAAIFLPALGGSVVSLLSISGSQSLTRAYGENAETLRRIAVRLRDLRADMHAQTRPLEAIAFEFKRLGLQTEEVIADDLRHWWLLMEPEAPRAGA